MGRSLPVEVRRPQEYAREGAKASCMADGCVDGDQRLQLSRCQQMWRDNNDSGDGNG